MHDKELNIFINPFLSVEDLEVFYKDNKLNNEMLQKQCYQFTPIILKFFKKLKNIIH